MMHLLDTDVVLLYLHKHESAVRVVLSLLREQLALSALTIAEITGDAHYRSTIKQRALERFTDTLTIVPVDGAVATQFGALRRQLRTANRQLGDIDLFIAATALVHQAPLVTASHTRYVQIPQLELVTVV